jgi:phosphatidylglycerophosphate synthase
LLSFACVLGLALVSMPVYAWLGRSRDADASRKGSRFLAGVGDFLVHWFMWAISPAERLALRLGATPDLFNFLGLGFGLASGGLIAFGQLPLGGWGIALGGICDILDGRIARATGAPSAYGKFIDSSLDRFVEVFVFLGFVVYLRDSAWGAFLAAASLAGSLLVSYATARGETVGVPCHRGLMQRAERLVLTCLVCLVAPPMMALLLVLALIAATTFGTAIYRTVWISRRLR